MAILQQANAQRAGNLVDNELLASDQTAAYTASGIAQVGGSDAIIDLFEGNDNWDLTSNTNIRCYVNINDVDGDVTFEVRESSDPAGAVVVRTQQVYTSAAADVGQVELTFRPVERYVHLFLNFGAATTLTLGGTTPADDQPGAFFTYDAVR